MSELAIPDRDDKSKANIQADYKGVKNCELFGDSPESTDEIIQSAIDWPGVVSVSLTDMREEIVRPLDQLLQFARIESFSVENQPVGGIINDELLYLLSRQSTLRHLAIPNQEITDEGLTHLRNTGLVSIDISDCWQISTGGIEAVLGIASLKSFVAERSRQSRWILNVEICKLIGHHPELEAVALPFGGRLSPEMAVKLSESNTIQRLNLRHVEIDPAAVFYLGEIPCLKELDLRHTGVRRSDLPVKLTENTGCQVLTD